MIRYYRDVEQRSDEWHELRLGMVTASAVGTLITSRPADPISVDCRLCHAPAGDPCISVARKTPTPIKTAHEPRVASALTLPPVLVPSRSDSAKLLMHALVAERITGWADPVFVSADMLRGVLDEPIARDHYNRHVAPVTECGYITRDDWGFPIGYSPDGLVGDDGLIEVKSRRPKTHLRTILTDAVPDENLAQIQTGLLVSGRAWCDYVSWCGGMPMWRIRVYPDRDWQNAIREAVSDFEAAAAEMVATYTERTAGLPATERTPDYDDIQIGV